MSTCEWLHWTSQCGWKMPLNEHVYCVAVAFKMTEWVEQWICIRFYTKLERSSTQTIQMTQKATAVATGEWQLHHDNASAHASHLVQSFFCKTSNHPGDLVPLQFRFGFLWLLAFPQNLNHLWKGRDFRLSLRFRKIWWGSWWRLGELCEVPRCLLWRGLRRHCPIYNVSCILYLLQ